MKYVCGIDIGTTGTKAIVFSQTGEKVASAYTEYPCSFPESGWSEQDWDQMFSQMCDATKECLEKSGLDPKDIVSLSISSQRCTLICVDENEKALAPCITWQDRRSFEECREIDNIIGEDKYYEITGLPNDPTWSVSKIMWIKKHKPDLYNKANKFVLCHDLYLKILGADNYYQDWSNGSLYGLMDIQKFEWHKELTEKLAIDMEKLPILVPSGKVIGTVDANGSKLSGFAEGTLLVAGGGDQQCAAMGAGATKKGVIEVTIGTAGVTVAYMDSPIYDKSKKLPLSAHTVAGKWETEGLQLAAGSALKWFRNELALKEMMESAELGVDPFKLIDDEVAKLKPCDGIICLPFFAGSAAPHWDPFARGTFVGLGLGTSRIQLARTIMEGVSFETREIIEQMLTNGVSIDTVVLTGGAAKSSIWNQIQADIFGITCGKLKIEEATSLGAAILAALGAGLYADQDEAVEKMVSIVDYAQPNEENHKTYTKYFQIYKDVYKALRDSNVFERLYNLSTE